MDKRWNFKPLPQKEEVESISQQLNINPALSSILLQREIDSFEKAKSFFRPSLNSLQDPFLMKGMEKAVNRLGDAISNQENILIYGDYDVDGSCSVAMMFTFLKNFQENIGYYVPDRYKEGYGVSEKGIDFAIDNDINLIITLDCGIRANKTIARARENNIDVIICDHHLPGDILPSAYAVLDPKQIDCDYPFKELCGCGVGFKLIQAFCIENGVAENAYLDLLDYVAIATAADIVSMSGENRVLTYYGFKKINENTRIGILKLIEKSGYSFPLNVTNVVFGIAPRINAAGRIEHAAHAVEVLIEENDKKAQLFANAIENYNSIRKDLDQGITQEALEQIHQEDPENELKSTVLYGEDWNKGVIGIVASRCIEHYYRPTIILTESEGKITGSARSVKGFDIHNALEKCSVYLEQFGGHKYAAGLTMDKSQLKDFKLNFEKTVCNKIKDENFTPIIDVDLAIDFELISMKFLNIINQMAPFGPDNMQPIFITKSVYDTGNSRIVKDKHIKLSIQQYGVEMNGIAFGLAEHYEKIRSGRAFSICYTIEENNFRGKTELQLVIKDIKFE